MNRKESDERIAMRWTENTVAEETGETGKTAAGLIASKTSMAINHAMIDHEIMQNELIPGFPTVQMTEKLKRKGYEIIVEVDGSEIVRGLFSELRPHYYMPHLKKPDGSSNMLKGEDLKAIYHNMDRGDELEQIAMLAERLDLPTDVMVYMINGF